MTKPHLRLHYQPANNSGRPMAFPWWIEVRNFSWTPSYWTGNRRTVPEVLTLVARHCQPE